MHCLMGENIEEAGLALVGIILFNVLKYLYNTGGLGFSFIRKRKGERRMKIQSNVPKAGEAKRVVCSI